MGKHAEIVKFEGAVDKAAAAWAAEVTKYIEQLKENVAAASRSLRGKVAAIPVPKGSPDKEFAALERSINETIAKRTSGLEITVKLEVTVDAKAKSLAITGLQYGLPMLKS